MSNHWTLHQYEDDLDRWVGHKDIGEAVVGPFPIAMAQRVEGQLNDLDHYAFGWLPGQRLAQLVLAYRDTLTTHTFEMTREEREADQLRVEEAYRVMVALATQLQEGV